MRPPQPPPQGDADQEPREYVTVHEDGTKEHRTKRGHRGQTIEGNRHGKRVLEALASPDSVIRPGHGRYSGKTFANTTAERVLQDMGQGTSPPRRSWQRLKLGGR